jgi:hypothetical protein
MIATEYFKKKVLAKRPYLKNEWIDYVVKNAVKKEHQKEKNRIKHWAYIKECEKYIKVITLNDGVTIHNAYPDKNFEL